MKILFVVNSFGMGGAEKQLVFLSREHILIGNEVRIVRLKDFPDDLLNEVDGIVTYSLGMSSIKGVVTCLYQVKRILKAYQPDVMHAHLPHSIVFARIAKFILRWKGKLVSTAHNYNVRTRFFGVAYRWTDFLSDYNTNVSEAAVNRYIKEKLFSSDKTSYVPNGFNIKTDNELALYNQEEIKSELGFSEADYICCAIGRLDAQKNYEMMLRAFSEVAKIEPSFKLIILGGGPEEGQLKRLAAELAIDDRVVMLGIVKDVYRYLMISNLYLMSSVFEGMPLSICEAMIANRPMVVTNFVGVREFVKDYYPIVDVNDYKKFAEKILESKRLDYSDSIRKARSNIISQYSIQSVVAQWVSIYEK